MNIKDSTIDLYQKNYARLISELGYPLTVPNLRNYFYEREKPLKTNTIISYLTSIVKMEDLTEGDIFEWLEGLREIDKRNKPYKQEEIDMNFSYDEVYNKFKLFQDLEKCKQNDHLKYVILALYSYLPPLRGSEYLNMKFSDDKTSNFMDLNRALLIIRNSKTIKKDSGRIRVIQMPPELVKIFKSWQNILGSENSHGYIFGRKISSSNFTNILNSIFGRKISVDMLRKAYITEYAAKMSIAERKILAAKMGHSFDTQISLYDKNLTDDKVL